MINERPLVFFDIDDVLFQTQNFIDSSRTEFKLYGDVLSLLDDLGKDYDVGILSQGDNRLQIRKLVETGIETRFSKDHIHIVERKDESLREVLGQYINLKQIFYIDDRLTGLYHAKQILPHIKTIWVKRGRHIESQEPIESFNPDLTVSDLSSIAEFINLRTGIEYEINN